MTSSNNAVFDIPSIATLTQANHPTDKQLISLTLDDVKAYDNNTRSSQNLLYSEIKESIRVRGLDNIPTVTKRPGDDHYMIMQGGNTRLAILNELYLEVQQKIKQAQSSGDQSLIAHLKIESERYFRHQWKYKDYVSEIDCFVGHVVENEQRANTLFIDKALSVSKFRDFFASSIDVKNNRELATKISQKGWPISHTNVSIMLFAIDHLYPFIPNLMHSGLSKLKTLELRKLQNNYLRYINELHHTDMTANHFIVLWQSTLSNYDSDDLKSYTIDAIEQALNKAIALRSGIPVFISNAHIAEIEKKSSIRSSEKPKKTKEHDLKQTKREKPETKNNGKTNPARWSRAFEQAQKLATLHHIEKCLLPTDHFPGFLIKSQPNLASQEKIDKAIWFWLRSLCTTTLEELLLETSDISISQVLELNILLSQEKLKCRNVQHLMANLEQTIITDNKD